MSVFRTTYSVKKIGTDFCAEFNVDTMDEAIKALNELYKHTKDAKILEKTEDFARLEVTVNDYDFTYYIRKQEGKEDASK